MSHSLLHGFNFYVTGHCYYVIKIEKLEQWVVMSYLDNMSLE